MFNESGSPSIMIINWRFDTVYPSQDFPYVPLSIASAPSVGGQELTLLLTGMGA